MLLKKTKMFFLEGFALLPTRAGPGPGPYGPIWAGPIWARKFEKLHNKFALIGVFTGPVTLP